MMRALAMREWRRVIDSANRVEGRLGRQVRSRRRMAEFED